MSFVSRVQTSFPCAQTCEEGIGSSRSVAASKASIVVMVCSRSSRIAPRTVSAMSSSARPISSGLLDPFVLGAAGSVVGILRQHLERHLAFVFQERCLARRSRRAVAQLTILKIELTFGRRARNRRRLVSSVRRDGHVCAFVPLLAGDPATPAPGELLDVTDLLFAGDSGEWGQCERGSKKYHQNRLHR